MERAFGGYHPLVNFIFFILAAVFAMFFSNPFFLVVSVTASVLYLFILKGTRAGGTFLWAMVLFIMVTLLNPIFNTAGETVLFWYLGRSFTLEALLYGGVMGGIFLTVMLWFSCYNEIMTSDKFIFLFGRLIPSVSLILTMILRLVPSLQRKISQISGARRCIGKYSDENKRDKLKNTMDVLCVLMAVSLEGAVITSDSMRSRGYGLKGRTSFAAYEFRARDIIISCIMFLSAAGVIYSAVMGCTSAEFIPSVKIAELNSNGIVGLASYAVLLLIPSFIHIKEAAAWRILKYGI